VTVTAPDGVYYDPYDVQINADPYLAFRGLREEVPLYYNEQHDFYALSRLDPPIHDVHRKLLARMFTPRKIGDAGGSRLSQTQIRK
jgi:hypothetical protein